MACCICAGSVFNSCSSLDVSLRSVWSAFKRSSSLFIPLVYMGSKRFEDDERYIYSRVLIGVN